MSIETITVHVTEDDLLTGESGAAFDCPVALALARVCPKGYTYGVTHTYVSVAIQNGSEIEYDTSRHIRHTPKLQAFIEAFDNPGERSKLKPFSFEFPADPYAAALPYG